LSRIRDKQALTSRLTDALVSAKKMARQISFCRAILLSERVTAHGDRSIIRLVVALF
jgi:hypothetical protein